MTTKRIAVANSKGGVGKSTISLELAAGLRKRGYKTLLVDCDAQGSLSAGASLDIEDDNLKTIKDILDGENPENVIYHDTPFGDIIANNLKMFNAEQVYSSQIGSNKKIKKTLNKLEKDYDYIILDCAPAFSFTTISAFIAADTIIVPQLASMFSLISMRQLKVMIDLIKEDENPSLDILGIILSKWNPRTRFSKDLLTVLDEVSKEMDTSVFDTKIRTAIAIEESITSHQSIYDYAPDSKITQDFTAFVDEVLARLKERDDRKEKGDNN